MEFLDKIKEFISYNKITLIGGVFLLIVILLSNFGIYIMFNDKISNIEVKEIATNVVKEEKEDNEEETQYYWIDIKGEVNNPGVYKLQKGSRVIDAINMAGGLTSNADTSVNNLSKNIKDEMVIVVYKQVEVNSFSEVKQKENIENNNCVNYNEEIKNDSCIDNNDIVASEVDTKISINTANIELLMTLPGIGEAKAKSIVEYRENKGNFTTIQDIMNVSGIGEALFEKIKNYITT